MKSLAFIKLTLKSTLKNLLPLILTFSIFPLLLGMVVGYLNEDIFVPSADMPVMRVSILDEDNSQESNNLMSFFMREEMGQLVEVKEEEDSEYIIRIPKEYGESLLDKGDIQIEVEVTDDGSTSQGNMLAEIIDKYNDERYLNIMIQRSIDKKAIDNEDKGELFQNITGEISKIYNKTVIDNNIVTSRKSLTSYEHFSITFFSYMLFMIISSLANGEYVSRESGILPRIMAAPLTDIQYHNCNLISSYIFVVLFNFLYVFTYRLFGLSFSGSLPLLIVIVLVQSLLGTILGESLSLFLKKKASNAILNILIMIQLIVGVTYAPLKRIGNGVLMNIVEKYMPDTLIVNTYRSYLIYNDFNSVKIGLIAMVVLSIVLYTISLIRIKAKRGEAW